MAAYAPIKINYNPVTTYPGTAVNTTVGAQTVVGQRGTLPSFTNVNSLYVAKTGNDANVGTSASPKLTLAGALSALTAGIQYIVIKDSGTYNEGIASSVTAVAGFVGIYAADGQAPVFALQKGAVQGTYGAGNSTRNPGAANYYVAKTGSDSNPGTSGSPFLTVQKALNTISANQVIQIQDSGVYKQDLTAATSGTIQAAAGQTPTLRANSLTTGSGNFTQSASTVVIEGCILDGQGSQGGFWQMSSASGVYSVTLKNCTLKNYLYMTVVPSNVVTSPTITLTNSAFINLNSTTYNIALPGGAAGLFIGTVTNCYFSGYNQQQNSQSSANFLAATVTLSTFYNCYLNVSGSNTVLHNYCFYQNATFYAGTWSGSSTVTLQNSVIANGQVIAYSPSNSSLLAFNMTNVVVYANANGGNGISISGNNSTPLITYTLKNVIVCGSQVSNYYFNGTTGNPIGTMTNCTSLAAGTNAINYQIAVNNTVINFMDSGSPVFYNGGASYQSNWYNYGSYPAVSTVPGSWNATPTANSGAVLMGQGNNGCPQNIGYDVALFDIGFPCTLNGLTFSTWTPPSGSFISPNCQEGGVQSTADALLTIQYCTFTNGGPFGIKAPTSCTVSNCWFACAGHAIEMGQVNCNVSYSVGYVCGGAFFANYGTGSYATNCTAYGCEYGEYDAPWVTSTTNNSNIYAGSGTYDLSADIAPSYSCIGTLDPTRLVTTLTSNYNTQMDPLFQNAAGGNVLLQDPAWGYFWSSPAKGAGIVGQDMGAYAVTYGTASTAWTTIDFSINDPTTGAPWRNPDTVERKIIAAKLAEGDTEAGAIYSVAATFKTEYLFTWNTATNDMPLGQLAALMPLFKSWTNQIQVNFGDGRGFVACYLGRSDGFEYTDLTHLYSTNTVPQPLKSLIVREA